MLHCKEFVNADSIAAGLSPFNPESVAFEAGKIMVARIYELLKAGVDFAFETTLAAGSYLVLVKSAQMFGFKVILLFMWLDSPKSAVERVAIRASKGGHDIPQEVIEPIAEGGRGIGNTISNGYVWEVILDQSKIDGNKQSRVDRTF